MDMVIEGLLKGAFMKTVIGLGVVVCCFVMSCACHKLPAGAIQGTGTITQIGLEGGFFGIVSDDSLHYDPVNLPDEFKQDGLRVKFAVKTLENQMSIHMWGQIVEVISIKKL